MGLEADFQRERATCGHRRTEGKETNVGFRRSAERERERESESKSVREEEEMQRGWVYSGLRTEKPAPFFRFKHAI